MGLQIERDRANKKLFIHQKAYTKQILVRFNMQNEYPVSMPLNPSVVLRSAEGNVNFNFPYRETIGSLMYLVDFNSS